MSLRLYVKGSTKHAQRAAARRGIPVRCVPSDRGASVCHTPCANELRVAYWFGERGTMRKGRGHVPGVLLHYSNTACPGPSSLHPLKGARRRRRRR